MRFSEQHWGVLRSILQQQSTPATWHQLCDWIMHNEQVLHDEGAYGYLHQSLERWPDALRVVPDAWLGLMYMAQTSPFFNLCRTLQLHHLTSFEPARRVRDIWSHPRRLPIAQRTPHAFDMVQYGPTLNHVDRLWTHRQFENFTIIDASYNAHDAFSWVAHAFDADELGVENFDRRHIQAMLQSKHLGELHTLKFNHIDLGPSEIKAIVLAQQVNSLLHLEFQHNTLGPGLSSLFDGVWSSLQTLSLRSSSSNWLVLKTILESAALPALMTLDLARSMMNGVAQLAPITSHASSRLTTLDLSGCNLTLKTMQWLAKSDMPTTLDTLVLSRTKIDRRNLDALCRGSWFKQIQTLDLMFIESEFTASNINALLHKYHMPKNVQLGFSHKETYSLVSDTQHLNTMPHDFGWCAWTYGAKTLFGRDVINWNESQSDELVPTSDAVLRLIPNKFSDDPELFKHSPAPVNNMLSVGTSYKPALMCQSFIKRFAPGHAKTLRALTWHDVSDEETHLGHIYNSSVTTLLHTFSALEYFAIKGANGLRFDGLEHQSLRTLIVATNGLTREIVQDLNTATLPKLEALELWIGSNEHGLNVDILDLETLLTNQNPNGTKRFPSLKHLGLCNNKSLPWQVINRLLVSPLLDQLVTLDLRFCNLQDVDVVGFFRVLQTSKIKRLILDQNMLTSKLHTDPLRRRGVEVVWGVQRLRSAFD